MKSLRLIDRHNYWFAKIGSQLALKERCNLMRRVHYTDLDVLKCKLKVVLAIFTLNRFEMGPG